MIQFYHLVDAHDRIIQEFETGSGIMMNKCDQELNEIAAKFDAIDTTLRADLNKAYNSAITAAYNVGCAKNGYFKAVVHTFAHNVDNEQLSDKDFRQFIRNTVKEFIPIKDKYIGKTVTITKIHDGCGYTSNDLKYIGRAAGQSVRIVSHYKGPLYVTNFFLGTGFGNNDYCKDGYLIISIDNFI